MHKLHPCERARFHQLYNSWLTSASDADLDDLQRAQDKYLPDGEVCSTLTFIRSCLASNDRRKALPASLIRLFTAHQWPKVLWPAPFVGKCA